jgi:heme o synthase
MSAALITTTHRRRSARSILRDYSGLTKPRIVLMVLITVAVGYVLGAGDSLGFGGLALTLVGTGLVAAGASGWNQVLERDRDARMRRTARRPLPAGRLEHGPAAAFSTALAGLGIALLGMGQHPLAAGVALATFLLYAFVYTWLKPRTTLNTAVGAIPGALPPVIGWTAATGFLGVEPLVLFLIMFFWQFPHFLAIAWIYRDDYIRGGMRMLSGYDPTGSLTSRQAVWYGLALIPIAVMPTLIGMAGVYYATGALILSIVYAATAIGFCRSVSDQTARRLLRCSFLYLPAILLLLLLNSSAA